jgi:cobalt-zinc-cadmium efflux system outer membrane protein
MCRFFVPFALALTSLTGSHALAQNKGGAAVPPLAQATGTANLAVSRPLTLDTAIRTAFDGNPELSAARREVEAVQGARIQAGVFPNPTLNAQIEDLKRDTRTTTVLLSQPIEFGGKRGARIEAAERAIEVARAQLEARQADLRANVTAAFFAALIAQDRVEPGGKGKPGGGEPRAGRQGVADRGNESQGRRSGRSSRTGAGAG